MNIKKVKVTEVGPRDGFQSEKTILNTEDKIEKAAARHPLNKIGTAKEIAQLTQYLLDEKSKWITGQIINIDGGISSVKVN